MKNILFIFCIILTSAGFNLLTAQSSDYVIISASDVNMREKPDASSKLITKLQMGQIGKVQERSAETANIGIDLGSELTYFYWYKIKVGTQSGWVYGAFAFEMKEVAEFRPPADWYDANSERVAAAPSWYQDKDLKIYHAYTGTDGIMGARVSFFVMLNGTVGLDAKVILLEADKTIEKYKERYLSNGTAGHNVFVAKFDEKQNLQIFISTSGDCQLCSSMSIWEGSYNAAKQTYMFTEKYDKRCH